VSDKPDDWTPLGQALPGGVNQLQTILETDPRLYTHEQVAELVKAAHEMLEDLDSRESVAEMLPAKAAAFRGPVAAVEPFKPWRSVNEP
jgi:hypothetical protein